ncbi:MAG: type II secretion system F family protein [Gallionella sp.]|nr:type II secretion system F family protein [Gallionella sp.]
MNFEIKAYKAPQGTVLLHYDAANLHDALRRAEAEGYKIISSKVLRLLPGLTRRYRFPLALFSQELYSLLEAGLPLLEAIETLAAKEQQPQAREVYAGLNRLLNEGRPLSQAMQEYADVFPSLYVATIRASEHTGELQQALSRYLAYHGQLDAVRKKVVSAAIYPVLLMLVGSLVILFLMVYVVPRFSKVYEDMGSDLPLLSRVLMAWGQFFEAYSWSITISLILLLIGTGYALTRSGVRDWLQRKAWQIPSIGMRLHLYQLARLYRTLGMLLKGGIPLVAALDMVAGLLSQPSMRANLSAARQRISEGQSISESMLQCQLTTEVAYRMLRVGERSGNLGEMMDKIAGFCDEEIARWVEWFTRLFEPMLMLFIGFVIGGIVLLMYMPVFELAESIQ